MVRAKKERKKSDESLPPGAFRMVNGSIFQWTAQDHDDVYRAFHGLTLKKDNTKFDIDAYLDNLKQDKE